MTQNIYFFSHEIDFTLEQEEPVINWLLSLLQANEAEAESINYVFCSDTYLLKLNQGHLQHDYLTDILTFPYSTLPAPITADIYISIDRIRENASSFQTSFKDELHRVMAHGLLHLLGYDDHEEADIARMRAAENQALAARTF